MACTNCGKPGHNALTCADDGSADADPKPMSSRPKPAKPEKARATKRKRRDGKRAAPSPAQQPNAMLDGLGLDNAARESGRAFLGHLRRIHTNLGAAIKHVDELVEAL